MNEELLEKLIKTQLELTEKFSQILDIVKLQMESMILQNTQRELQSAQNMSILSALQYRGDK